VVIYLISAHYTLPSISNLTVTPLHIIKIICFQNFQRMSTANKAKLAMQQRQTHKQHQLYLPMTLPMARQVVRYMIGTGLAKEKAAATAAAATTTVRRDVESNADAGADDIKNGMCSLLGPSCCVL
jgi:hypothetical protein